MPCWMPGDRGLDVAVAGQDEALGVGPLLAQTRGQLDAARLGHHQVEHGRGERLAGGARKGSAGSVNATTS